MNKKQSPWARLKAENARLANQNWELTCRIDAILTDPEAYAKEKAEYTMMDNVAVRMGKAMRIQIEDAILGGM